MKINRYITKGINEHLSLDLQILLWNMVKERDNQPHTDYLHIFRLQEDDKNILSITHEQEQPTYKLEYHYTNYVKNQNALPKKVYVIREDDVDTFYYVMLLPEEY